MADEADKPATKRTAKPKMVRITPLRLRGVGAHLHCSTGRVQMGAAIEVPAEEAETLFEVGRAEKASEEQADFIDEPREKAALGNNDAKGV